MQSPRVAMAQGPGESPARATAAQGSGGNSPGEFVRSEQPTRAEQVATPNSTCTEVPGSSVALDLVQKLWLQQNQKTQEM
jgi:hypothetical protein